MKKKILITKREINNKKNILAINKAINKFKKEFRQRKFNHIGNLYIILNTIVKLKQQSNSRYTARSLEWEKDLKLSSRDIRYIFSYQYLSSFTLKKIKECEIEDTTICNLLATSAVLREPQMQNEMVKKLISKELKPSSISELTKTNIKRVIMEHRKPSDIEDDNYFMAVIKNIRNIKYRIEDRKESLKISIYNKKLLVAINNLNKSVKEILKRKH